MKRFFTSFIQKVFFLITLVVCIAYLSTCLLPYIDTGKYWYISFLGIGFPILLLGLLVLMIFWLFARSRMWIVCLVVLLIGFQQINALIAFHFPVDFVMKKDSSNLRIMQWNVHNWNQIRFEDEEAFDENSQPDMMQLIKKYDADVLCFEEFFESVDSVKLPSNVAALTAMGYPYYYFLHDDLIDGYYFAGIAIFSKYPITESGRVIVSENESANPLAYSDVHVNGKTIRIIAVHLQSVRFESSDYQNLSKIKRARDPNIHAGKTILSKLKAGFQKRYEQAVKVKSQIEESPYPVVLCGDFNDVPNSGTYFTISKHLQDAFLKKGTFIGRTFRYISPTLRIDYILPAKSFKVKQFKLIHVPYSDHYPLVADLDCNLPLTKAYALPDNKDPG